MARKMPLEQLERELADKGLILISSYDDYKNVNTPIMVECKNGHGMQTSLNTVRSDNFNCSFCVGSATISKFVSSVKVPEKKGFRVIGFDNASHNMGVAIYDDGKLVYYDLLQFTKGNAIQRLNSIRDMLEDTILLEWQPDVVQIEGIQHQNSYATYEVLIKLHGLFEMACDRFGVCFESTRSSQWRSHHNINKRNRSADKKAAIQKVKEMYDLNVGDDVAEAILIAKYRVDQINKEELGDLF